MTRDEMLRDIDWLRSKNGGSHEIGIVGHVGDFVCNFDDKTGKGATPMEAYEAAKKAAAL